MRGGGKWWNTDLPVYFTFSTSPFFLLNSGDSAFKQFVGIWQAQDFIQSLF